MKTEQTTPTNNAATAAPRMYSAEDFKRWGAEGGRGASREDKVRAAKIRWAKARRKRGKKARK